MIRLVRPSQQVRRYTHLASALHILRTKSLTLLDPKTWDDRNDSYYMEMYKKHYSAKTALALCFARANETYHHWRVFSPGSDGVCLEFNRVKLATMLKELDVKGVLRLGNVNYLTLTELRETEFDAAQLPFLKRWAFGDEKEWRIIYREQKAVKRSYDLAIQLSCLSRIILNPWMPQSLAASVTQTIHSIPGCKSLPVTRSTLIENEEWKRHAANE